MANFPFNRKRLFTVTFFLKLFLAIVGLLIIAVLGMPLWLGWGLRTFSDKELIRFEKYETEGYGRFKLEGVSITHPQVSISIDELSALSPLNWLRYSLLGGQVENVVTAGEVRVELPESNPDTEVPDRQASAVPGDLPEAIALTETILHHMDKWLPRASIKKAILVKGEYQMDFDGLNWNNRKLSFSGQLNKFPEYPLQLSLNLQAEDYLLSLKIPNAELDITTSLQESTSQWVANSILLYKDNTAFLEASFGEANWSPESATWNLSDWDLDLNSLGLNSTYSALNFNLQGDWNDGVVANSLDGQIALANDTPNENFPPVDFQSQINGNTQSLSLSRFSLDAPGINARINEPVQYNLQQMQLAGDLRFDIDFDLGLLNLDDVEGRLAGLLEISTDEGKPTGKFVLQGSAVKVKAQEFEVLEITADLLWPVLQLHTVKAQLTTGSSFQMDGIVDLHARQLEDTNLEGKVAQKTLEDLLPESLALDTISFSAQASGPFEAIQHRGSLDVRSIETQALRPLSVSANWDGESKDLSQVQLTISNENNVIKLTAAGNLDTENMQWQLSHMAIENADALSVKIATPASLTIERGELVSLSLKDFDLQGSDQRIIVEGELQYPKSGAFEVKAENIHAATWMSPWLKNPPPDIELKPLIGKAAWVDGPIRFDASMDAVLIHRDTPISAKGGISSNGQSIHFSDVEISDSGGPWITVRGDAPLSIYPAETEKLKISKEGLLDITLSTTESQNWLDWLSSISRFQFDKFNSRLRLHGSLNELRGNFDLEVATKEIKEDHGMPSTRVQLQGDIENTVLNISTMNVSVLEEMLQVSGSLSLPESLIDKIDNPAAEVAWQTTAFDLQIPSSKLTPMRYFFPQLLSTGGQIEANLKGSLEDGIAGYLRIKGMNTRAVFPFGSLRELSADLEFEKSQANLKNISGYIGREPVRISGSMDYSQWDKPTYHFSIAGNDLPILRKPGLLLRSDLNLAIDKDSDKPAAVTGKVTLKDGLYLLNRSTILAGGTAGGRSASNRPPFFAVDIPPLSDWDLDIAVKGDQFIRVKTPAADGTLSLEMKLQGKLREPFATGRLEFDRGNIHFPFSSFKIDYGAAELPIENPYTPLVEILGSSRRFGYDIGVEITGSAYDPQIHFTSNPPLSSEQIMLMVMAGENPEGMFSYSGTQRASKLGTYISKGLFSSGSSGSFLSRLNLNSGENLSEQGKETMEIEYLLNEKFQVIGEYDEYDFWNTGLRWRMFNRRVRIPDNESPDK